MRLEPGQTAPEFYGVDQNDVAVSNVDFAGQNLLMYFYPKAFTPGCTTEACDFRDRYQAFAAAGYAIVGVSPDEPEKLARFHDEYELPFSLISDPDHKIAEAYGVLRETGRAARATFLIGRDGTILHAWPKVSITGHANDITAKLDELA